MKKKIRKQKRVSLGNLILRAAVCVALITTVVTAAYSSYLHQEIHAQAEGQVTENMLSAQEVINRCIAEHGDDREYCLQEIGIHLAMYQPYSVYLEGPFSFLLHREAVQIAPGITPDCYCASVLIAEDSTIAASSHSQLNTVLSFGENHADNGRYICDPVTLHTPQTDALFAACKEQEKLHDADAFVRLKMESVYINRQRHWFIPHKGNMIVRSYENTEPEETEIPFEYTLDADSDFELIEVHQGDGAAYPLCYLTMFYGQEQESVNLLGKDIPYQFMSEENYGPGGEIGTQDGNMLYLQNRIVHIGEKQYLLSVRLMLNPDTAVVKNLIFETMLITFGLLLLIAALFIWRIHALNQAKYAYEDMRRDLTNHLAHDIKTPLTAIGGYAENLLEGQLTPDEQRQYLQSILDNVTFTDKLVRDTLYLNSLENGITLKKEPVNAESVIGAAFEKYQILLEEKQIQWSVQGSAVIQADRAEFEKVIENLISNAIKYTPEHGTVRAELSGNRIMIVNTVSQKVDTKDLKKPFVRGDKARSNADGAGLGLSIAEQAANANGLRLHISCTDTAFSAELK